MTRFFLASVTLHLVCVRAIDSNANNLVSRHSTCTCRDQNICPRRFFSRVSSPREILSGRQPVHTSHTSVWRYARDIEISLHRKFVRGIYDGGSTPRVSSNRFRATAESRASALRKRLQFLNGYVKTRCIWPRHLSNISPREERWFKASGCTLLLRCCNIDISKLGQPIASYDS